MEAIVEQLLRYPQVHLYLQQVQDALREEQVRRKAFHDSLTDDTDAEFINGEIIEKVSTDLGHNEATGFLYRLLSVFAGRNKLGKAGIEKLMVSLTRNDYEPGVCFWKSERAIRFSSEQRLFPAPDFIAEVLSGSTQKRDRGIKFQDYAAHGVGEYWIIDSERQTVEQYKLVNGQYELLEKKHTGAIASAVVEGFVVPVEAIFDEQRNLEVLTGILKS
ncbi:MAG: Uma2 family endonuclease [Cytophagales bacterium]|nr:Uma2 family endonuclease [Cytophagales bacterium]